MYTTHAHNPSALSAAAPVGKDGQASASAAEQLQFIADNVPAMVAHVDRQCRYLFVNKSYAARFGLTPEQVIGQSIAEVAGSKAFETLRPHIEACLAGQELSWDSEVDYREIGTRVMRVYYTPDRKEDGSIHGLLAVIHDITESQRTQDALRESEAKFHTLADHIAQLVWMADGDGAIFWYNRRWFDYTGMTLEAMEGWGWKSVHHPDHLDRVVEKWSKHLRAGQEWEDTFPLRGRDGQYRWFLSRAIPIRNEADEIVRWFGSNTDVTELRQALEENQKLNARLRRAMTETHHRVRNSLQLLTALIDLQAANADMSVPVELTAQFNQHISALSTVHDLLTEQAKIEGDAQTIPVGSLLGKLLREFQKMTAGKRLEFDIEDALLPAGPATALALSVNELVSNALKYGQGVVEVRFTVQDEIGILEVLDDGPGFPVDFQPALAARTGLDLVINLVTLDLEGTLRFGCRAQGGGRVAITVPMPETDPEDPMQ